MARDTARDHPDGGSPHVLIIGAGFAGLEVARGLGRAGIRVTVVDRHNHHLFQPLLYQVATSALSAADIAEPIRRILRNLPSVSVVFGEVLRIDTQTHCAHLTSGRVIGYDHLVLATGSGQSYFGHHDWARWAPGLKSVTDATTIRSQLLLAFEKAEQSTDPIERDRLLHIAIVGGGPTGVELAGSIAELCHFTLARDFRSIDPGSARITLVEAGPRLLAGFSESASNYARDRLTRRGVRVRLGEAVKAIGPASIRIGEQEEPVGLVIWAAGVAASPLGAELGPTDRVGRVVVAPTLAVPGHADVFALGDVAAFAGPEGAPLPGLAQVARQQGIHLGRSLAAHLTDGAPLVPFTYRSRGNTAIVGRHAAVYEYRSLRARGAIAWLGWAVIHIYLLVAFQNRFLVATRWLWNYLTYHRGARLITVREGDTPQGAGSPVINAPPGDPKMAAPPQPDPGNHSPADPLSAPHLQEKTCGPSTP